MMASVRAHNVGIIPQVIDKIVKICTDKLNCNDRYIGHLCLKNILQVFEIY